MISTHHEFRAGGRAMLPVLVGIVPTGVAVGAGLSAAGVPFGPGLLSAATVYGATSQLVLADAAARGAPVLLTVAIVAIVSARLVFYGVGVGRRFCEASTAFRWLAPLLIVQPLHAVIDARLARPASLADRTAYFLGGGLTLWVAWQVAHAVGMLLGSVVPAALALDAALPLCLVAIVAPALRDRAVRTGALVAAVAAVVLTELPYGLGAVVGACVGIGVGARMVTR
jgi:predicted branched-subunit amino acid permease